MKWVTEYTHTASNCVAGFPTQTLAGNSWLLSISGVSLEPYSEPIPRSNTSNCVSKACPVTDMSFFLKRGPTAWEVSQFGDPIVVRHTGLELNALYLNASTASQYWHSSNPAGWGGHKVGNEYVPANRQWVDEYWRKRVSCLFAIMIMKSFLPVLVIALGSRVKAEGERDLIYLMRWGFFYLSLFVLI